MWSLGKVCTVAGSSAGFVDGMGIVAKFINPIGIAIHHATGNMYICDFGNNCIRKIDPQGKVYIAPILRYK